MNIEQVLKEHWETLPFWKMRKGFLERGYCAEQKQVLWDLYSGKD